MGVRQRSSDMERLYAESPTNDPWKNGERRLYDELLARTVLRIITHVATREKIPDVIKWRDICRAPAKG